MNRFETLQKIMADIFGIERNRITPATLQAEVPEWDSVGHLNLMLSVEDTFGVKLSVSDMQQLTSVPQILRYLGEV